MAGLANLLWAIEDDQAIGGRVGMTIRQRAMESYREYMHDAVNDWSAWTASQNAWRNDTLVSLRTLDDIYDGEESYIDDMIVYAEHNGATEFEIQLTLRMQDNIKPGHGKPGHRVNDHCLICVGYLSGYRR